MAANEDLVDLLGKEVIDAAYAQLRLGGGTCWGCSSKIRGTDDVSLIAHTAPTGGRIGFIHVSCGPPQIIDSHRNRQAAIQMNRYIENRFLDVQAFVMGREYPSPHGLLVVSPESGFTYKTENGETINPWLTTWLEAGFALLAPDVLDATPAIVEGWSLRVEGGKITCGSSEGALFEGEIDTPRPWLEIIASERQCVVLVVGIGVDSTELGPGTGSALNLLASKGAVAGGTVEVTNKSSASMQPGA